MKKIFIGSLSLFTFIPFVVACDSHTARHLNKDLDIIGNDFDQNIYLNSNNYNKLYDEIKLENSVAIAIIANHKIYTEVIPFNQNDSIKKIIDNSNKFDFKTYNTAHLNIGYWLQTFKLKSNLNWSHGTRKTKNYGDYYPLYFINHKFAQLGISNFHPTGKEVIEITYDNK